MPYITTWVEPEVFMVHKGIKVYHVYMNDEIEQGSSRYWYTTNAEQRDDAEDSFEFDVRRLGTWTADLSKLDYYGDEETKEIIDAIAAALDSGELKVPA
jgi:hypothetical protein